MRVFWTDLGIHKSGIGIQELVLGSWYLPVTKYWHDASQGSVSIEKLIRHRIGIGIGIGEKKKCCCGRKEASAR